MRIFALGLTLDTYRESVIRHMFRRRRWLTYKLDNVVCLCHTVQTVSTVGRKICLDTGVSVHMRRIPNHRMALSRILRKNMVHAVDPLAVT